jgi:hypothetical protein
MSVFATKREALDYLAERIVAEAKGENIPLSEIERKMLYFSETDWTLPEIKSVNEIFEQNYDDNEYERKIAGLISRIVAENRGQGDEEKAAAWAAASTKLSEGDYYLLVMFDMATSFSDGLSNSYIPALNAPSVRPPHDILKLWIVGFVAVFGILGIMLLWSWLYGHAGPRFQSLSDWIFDRNRSWIVGLIIGAILFGFALKSRR